MMISFEPRSGKRLAEQLAFGARAKGTEVNLASCVARHLGEAKGMSLMRQSGTLQILLLIIILITHLGLALHPRAVPVWE